MADPSGIPPDVLRLLDEQIHSVEQLEVLLLLQREPTRWWSAADVASTLRASSNSIQQRLEDLAERGLARLRADEATSLFGSGVLDPDKAETIHALAEAYRDRRVAVIDRIFSKPKANLLGFANAFKIKREPPS